MFRKKIKLFNSFTSTVLLVFLAVILSTVLLNQIYINNSLNNYTRYDSMLINKLGQIRGETQRYVKLYIVSDVKYKEVKKNIDSLFDDVSFYINKYQNIIPDKFVIKFFDYYNTTRSLWFRLKSSTDKKVILQLSEKIWNISNKTTCMMTKISEYKLNKLKKTVSILTIIIIFVLLLLFFMVFYLVKIGLEKATITDPLTKLYNRMFFDIQYKHLTNKYERNKTPFSAFLFDIDNFKKINDTFGHQKGDEVLEEISKILKNTIRETDFAFRYGGEEFIILLPDTKIAEAEKIAERIRKTIEENIILDNGKPVTISGGVGEFNHKFTVYSFLSEIDKSLYIAKNAGKNQIVSIF